MIDILMDTVMDCLKLIPFLFITYLVMEFLEHKTSDKTKHAIEKSGKFGPIIGGLVGAVPQCGFSAAASNLYAGRVITLGTLIAIYLSTSDEMLPIFISEAVAPALILKILAVKIVAGAVAGVLIDFVIRKRNMSQAMNIEDFCEHEHCHCEHGVIKPALMHTGRILIFIFITTFLLNAGIEFIGEDRLMNLVINQPVIGELIAGLVGLIPNCAASVVITQLYLEGIIQGGAMIAGLSVGAGVGILVLFKVNHNLKENLRIVGLLYIVGVVIGILVGLIGLV